MTHLPDDVLYMVCTQLWHQQDFNTLFNCACSGKQLASIAVTKLYRMQYTPGIEFYPNMQYTPGIEFYPNVLYSSCSGPVNHEENIMRLAGMWRTIILSSLGKTLYPYCLYIRTLDFKSLECLLIDHFYGAKARYYFFPGELAQVKVDGSVTTPGYYELDAEETMLRIGEAITKQIPLLKEFIAYKLSSRAVSRWIPRLPRLTHLSLKSEDGKALKGNGAIIRLNCPSFKELKVWNGRDTRNGDEGLADFLNELCPQSLESFETLDGYDFGPESFQALSRHGKSLKTLKLILFTPITVPKVSLLKGCTNLVSFSLHEDSWWAGFHTKGSDITDFEKLHDKYILETVAWLKKCNKLRILSFNEFYAAPALMVSIFLENSIHLTSLTYDCSELPDAIQFYQALGNQTSLQSLTLKGYVHEDVVGLDVLVESLSNLVNLTYLYMRQISDLFADRHIVQLASRLSKLEDWSTGGSMLTDAIWGEVAGLRLLRRLYLYDGSMLFMVDGILDFINKLGPGHDGLDITVVSMTKLSDISLMDRELIQLEMASKVNGFFRLCEHQRVHS